MSQPIDTAYVEIQPDASNFVRNAERDVDRVINALEGEFHQLTQSIETVFERLGDRIEDAFFEMSRDAERSFGAIETDATHAGTEIASEIERGAESAERSLNELQRSANRSFAAIQTGAAATSTRVGSSLGGLGAVAGVALGGAAVGIGAVLGGIATFGLKAAAELEQVRIQFASLLGSVEEGNRVFAELQKFAATTPFEFPDVARAAARFLAFNDAVGLTDEQLQTFLTTIGGVISVTGGGAEALQSVTMAMGQIASTGKLTLDNLNQISEALPGFSGVAAIANATGQTTAQVMEAISAGEISAVEGINSLLAGMAKFPGAAGAMEAQAQTLLGVFSTFKDTVGQALATAFEPVIPAIKASLVEITPIIGAALGDFVPALGQAIAALLPVVATLITAFAPILTMVSSLITTLSGPLERVFGSLSAIIISLVTPLEPLITVIGEVVAVLAEALVPVAIALAPILAELAQPLAEILLALLPLLPPLGELLAVLITLGTPLLQLTSAFLSFLIIEGIAPLVTLLTRGLTELIKPIAWLGNFIDGIDWGAVGSAIADGFTAAWDAVSEFFVGIGRFLASLPGRLLEFLQELPSMLVRGLERAFDAALQAVGRGIGLLLFAVLQLPSLVLNALQSLPGLLTNFFTDLWNDGVDRAEAGVDAIVGFLTALPGRILGALQALPGLLGSFFQSMWENVKRLAVDAFNFVVASAAAAPGRLLRLASTFLNAGKRLIGGFITGFKNVGSFIGDVAGSIVGTVKSFLNNVISRLNQGIKDIDDVLPGSLPRIPMLAQGGIAFGPSIIGEKPGSRGEAAIPLDDARALALLRNALGGDGDGQTITFEPGAITIVFSGVAPTYGEARRTGQAVGEGIIDALSASNTRANVRTL